MPGRGVQAKHWCFTLNNYTPEDLDRLSSPLNGVDYLIYGKEIGASGTPHLQGTVCVRSRKILRQVVGVIGQAHCSVTRSLLQSIEYCKKDGDFSEFGRVPEDALKRGRGSDTTSELEEFKHSVKEGVLCMKELRELHSEVCAAFPRFVREYVEDNRPKVQVTLTWCGKTRNPIDNLTPVTLMHYRLITTLCEIGRLLCIIG